MTSDETTEREKPAGVLAVGFGLIVILMVVLSLVPRPKPTLDGAALLAERFDFEALPFDYSVVDAVPLGRGQEMVVVADPEEYAARAAATPPPEPDASPEREDSSEPEPQPDAAASAEDEPSGEAEPDGSRATHGGIVTYDWGKVEPGEAGTAPVEIVFLWYPREMADVVLKRQFQQLKFQDLNMIEWKGGTATIDFDHIDWAGYRTSYVQDRRFERVAGKPVFTDVIRVNLSLGERCCVMYARWERGLPGSPDRAREVLEGLAPKLEG